MKISIKVLKGEGCTLDVEPSMKIEDVKKCIEEQLKIPVSNQKLLLLGRSLNNENTISAYPNIKEGTKLNLIVKQMEDSLDNAVYQAFRKYYSNPVSDKLAKRFLHHFNRQIQNMSLDELERLATSALLS